MNNKTNNEEKLMNGYKYISKIIILTLMFVLIAGMTLATIRLIILFVNLVVTPDPIPYLINLDDMYTVFTWLLIIVVGYELFKSLTLLLKHDQIPVKSILKIAAIAIANKVITTNIKTINLQAMIGVSVLIASVGLTFFFFSKDSDSD
jgi:uncharacterized membrane protein (DUF373 family)